jgi:integrase
LKVLTKKQKANDGWKIFEVEEIQRIYSIQGQADWYKKDRHFYLVMILALITGCRVSEMTGILKNQLRAEPVPHLKINDAKTKAGIRKVPLPKEFFDELMEFAKYKTDKQQVFKYLIRDGKGSGNAVGQKFGRYLDGIGIDDKKLVFHSLRKFFNDYSMRKFKVPLEVRCQMVGHELDNINVTTYANELEIEELSEIFLPVQENILKLIGKNS